MTNTVLITGASSGLGKSLANSFHQRGWNVIGLSRSGMPEFVKSVHVDLESTNDLKSIIEKEILENIDLCILNAGILGDVEHMDSLSLDSIKRAMDINCYSNKVIVDHLLKFCKTERFISISSGAAIKAYNGWGPYCLSKAALEMLMKLYAKENKDLKFVSLAPGLIKSPMQDYIQTIDSEKFPSMEKFHKAYKEMQTPDEIADKIMKNFHIIEAVESGGRIDLRELNTE